MNLPLMRENDAPMIIFQEIEIIREVKTNEPGNRVSLNSASRTPDNSYMLRRQ